MKQLLKEVYTKGFNIHAMLNRYKKAKGYALPDDVIIKVCQSYLKNPAIKNPWSWFTIAVKEASRDHFAGKNQKISNDIKNMAPIECLKGLVKL